MPPGSRIRVVFCEIGLSGEIAAQLRLNDRRVGVPNLGAELINAAYNWFC